MSIFGRVQNENDAVHVIAEEIAAIPSPSSRSTRATISANHPLPILNPPIRLPSRTPIPFFECFHSRNGHRTNIHYHRPVTMGKPFSNELKLLPASLKWAAEIDVTPLSKFVAQARGSLLVAVGAGGSFTSVEFARLLHEERGGTGLSHTPLSFLQSKTDIRNAYVIIFTASGNNRDVLATYESTVRREPQGILIVCGKKHSKIERKSKGCERTIVFSYAFPAGRDGYLATNSLVVFAVFVLRAFGHRPPTVEQVLDNSATAPRRWEGMKLPAGPSYYLALFGGWGRPAATDFESKFSEAGLGGVMLADYRHFAHGRHNWIDKRGEESTIVAFLTPDSTELAKRTLALLPASTRIIKLETRLDGPLGALALLLEVFRLTAHVGKRVGIDPGRPGIPSYGGRIYHLGPTPGTKRTAPEAATSATERKLAARGTLGNSADEAFIMKARGEYVARLSEARFGALVADFDGTVVPPGAGHGARLSKPVVTLFEKLLRNGISLYFATGRGDSIHAIIADSLDRKYHSRVFISYYNGGITTPITEAPPKPEGGPHHLEFEALLDQLRNDPFVARRAKVENKSFQLTLKATSQSDFPAASAAIRELVARQPAGRFRVVQSSHSLDVIPAESNKLNCVRLAQSQLLPGIGLLTVGDRGAMLSNDYELLTHPYSLSVDAVSASLDSCWNLLPAGVRNVSGLLHYAKLFRIRRGSFKLQFAAGETQ